MAFGELKINGQIDKFIKQEAVNALRIMKMLNERSKKIYPNWQYQEESWKKTCKMEAILQSL